MQSDVLISNATNFIGSNLCHYFMQHTKFMVTGIDDMVSGYVGNLQQYIGSRARFDLIPTKMEDSYLMYRIFGLTKPRYLILDASKSHYDEVITALDQAVALKVQKTFVIMPSNSAYEPYESKKEQNDALKLEAKLNEYVESYPEHKLFIIKPPELFGPRQSIDGLFAKLSTQVLSGQKECFNCDMILEWMYVKDLFLNIIKFIDEDFGSGTYILSSDKVASVASVFEFLQNIIAGNRDKVVLAKPLNYDGYAKNGIKINAIRHFDLEDSIEHTLCWYSDNKLWAWR